MKNPIAWLRKYRILLLSSCALIAAILAGGPGIPQNQGNMDSWKEDRIDSLLLHAKNYVKRDPDLALAYCDSLYFLSDSLDIQTGIIDALTQKCRIFSRQSNWDTALIFCREAIQISESINDLDRMAYAVFQEGLILYRSIGPFPAIKKFKNSYDHYRKGTDTSKICMVLNGIGAAFYEITEYDSALHYYFEVLRLAELRRDEKNMGRVCVNLGLLYIKTDDRDLAKTYLRKSIAINERLNNLRFVTNSYIQLGNLHVQEMDLDSAWMIFNKALEISVKDEYAIGRGDAYNGLGDVAEKRKDYRKALDYFNKSNKTYRAINYTQGLLITSINIGRIEVALGNIKKGLIIYDSCIEVAREAGYLSREAEILANIIDAYVRVGDFENAYYYQHKLSIINDSILNTEKQEKIADLTILYEVEKNNAEKLVLEAQSLEKDLTVERRTRQRNTYLYTGSGTLLIFIFFFSYYSQRTRKNRIIAEQKINQLEEEKKLLAARSIVVGQEDERKRIAKELHDGLGVLLSSAKMHFTTIRDRSTENKSLMDKAAKLLEQATGDVRRISHNMMPGLLTKYGLYEAIEDLFEQMDDIKGLKAKINIQGEQTRLPENTEIMLYRIIQEMANNSLKHAKAKTIELMVSIGLGKLTFQYADDGIGFDLAEKLKSKSMGLTSIQSRVKFLGGEVKVQSEPEKGVTYDFQIAI